MISPFFMGFSVVTFLLVMDFLLDYLELILEKGVAVLTVLKLFVLGLGWMVALSIPCGVLVGTLMTFGRMSQDNEILALRASGISLIALLRPAFAWGAFWTLALLLFHNFVLPWSNQQFAQLMLDVTRKKPAAQLEEGVFIDAFSGHRILFDELDARTGEIRGIKILDFERSKRLQTTTADRGRLTYQPANDLLLMDLEDGEINEVPDDAADAGTLRRTTFRSHRIAIGGASEDLARRTRKPGSREMTAGQLRSQIQTLEEKRDTAYEKQDDQLKALGYSGVEEFAAFVEPPTPWHKTLKDILRSTPVRAKPPPDHCFVGPPALRTLENFKTAKMQINAADKRAGQFRVEYHKKFSISFACLVFVLLGAPLGILTRRGGVRAGFMSVAFFLFYYLCLVGGEQLADRQLLWPWLGMWIANIVLGVLGLVLTVRVFDLVLPWRRHA